MANIVWHEKLRIELDLTREDLGWKDGPGLWELLYRTDRLYADRGVPVPERGLQCGGVCRGDLTPALSVSRPCLLTKSPHPLSGCSGRVWTPSSRLGPHGRKPTRAVFTTYSKPFRKGSTWPSSPASRRDCPVPSPSRASRARSLCYHLHTQ